MRTDYSTWGGKPRRSLQILPMIAAHGDSDECLEWPYNRKCDKLDYGYVRHEQKRWRVHRLAFKLGKPDKFDPSLDTLHACDNPPCFNLRHLFQGTQLDNMQDMDKKGRRVTNARPGILRGPNPLLQGENCGNAKLTKEKVLEIRRLYETGLYSQAEVAQMVGSTQINVSVIVRRITWKHV